VDDPWFRSEWGQPGEAFLSRDRECVIDELHHQRSIPGFPSCQNLQVVAGTFLDGDALHAMKRSL
ncbi:MAG: hypothetical protein SFW36_04515, partial [Leptolyngbyaceae cyanobacterium bins.59]|nr:hypothetical protein [Leptolyngbyaceae cyanobacterium bins.59]